MRTTKKAVRRECVIPQIVCKSAYYKNGECVLPLIRCIESVNYHKHGGLRVRTTKKAHSLRTAFLVVRTLYAPYLW